MKNEERTGCLNKKMIKVGRGTDWAWWVLIITVVITMVVALKEMLWAM